MDLSPGVGAFLENPGPEPFVVTVTGFVELKNPPLALRAGANNLVGTQLPRGGAISQLLDFPFISGDKVQLYDRGSGNYVTYTYLGAGWDQEPVIGTMASFFLELRPR